MWFLLLPYLMAQEPDEIKNGVSIYHSQGRFQTYRHIKLKLTPENTILPSNPEIIKKLGMSRTHQNYRQRVLDDKSDNFNYGQFEIFIPVAAFPLVDHKKGYMILRMPSTSSRAKKNFIEEKQNIYHRIVEMMNDKEGSVEVVVELPDPIERNIFFRDAGGRYVDYVGQYTKKR